MMRAEKVAAFVRHWADALWTQVPDRLFTMNVWGEQRGCGTVGCLAGWATMLQEADDVGLHLVKGELVYFEPDPVNPRRFIEHRGLRAIITLLDMRLEDGEYIFMPQSYQHPWNLQTALDRLCDHFDVTPPWERGLARAAPDSHPLLAGVRVPLLKAVEDPHDEAEAA